MFVASESFVTQALAPVPFVVLVLKEVSFVTADLLLQLFLASESFITRVLAPIPFVVLVLKEVSFVIADLFLGSLVTF